MSGTVLIVEDHEAVRDSLCKWLSAIHPQYQFIVASSGEEAVDIAHAQELALIIMDISLPGMSGIEAVRRIKSSDITAPIVMLTIHEDEVYRADAADAGACAYVAKRQMRTQLVPILHDLLTTLDSAGEAGHEE